MAEPVVITDADGRKLTLRELDVLDQIKLMRAMGVNCNIESYQAVVQAAAMVCDIDGRPQPMPLNERMIDGMMTRIGSSGLAAITVHLRKMNEQAMAEAEAALGGQATDPLANAAPSQNTPVSSN